MAEPEKPTLLQSIRRYTNTQISSVLHSLIGVPSMLQPPTFSDMDNAPNTTPTSSQPTTPSGEVSQQVVTGTGDGKGKRMINEEWKTIERQLFLQDPEEVLGNFLKSAGLGLKGALAQEMVWPRSGFGDVWVRELDAYAQLLPLSSRPENKTGGAIVSSNGQGKEGVVSSMAATRSVTVNGVTKTEYILKRRFSDGQEEMLQERITRRS
ncbi:hypothetical protein B9Z19DRAFT_1193832 [Tuber borchii]|uniref:Uncharacterized protein n=1 Tax=Tuber borchii TaxID=42251 RepID=A0A2T6ZQC1_TUBBO|nr:hypothetical protein B9Z19DRAFT_1193832 [Tuber borchii]